VRILVALKWVPLRPEVDPLTGAAAFDARFSGASPADNSALEWALRLAGATGGSVAVATVGPPGADAVLRPALAAGAEAAFRVNAAADGPSRWVGSELAALAEPYNLVLCGHASLDRGSGAVPAFLAHRLGWPQALGLVSLAFDGSPDDRPGDNPGHVSGPLLLERRLDGGRRERLRLSGRGVLSVEPGPELRRAPLTSTLAASTAFIDLRSPAHQPPAHPPTLTRRPYRPRARVVPPPHGPTRARLDQLLGSHEPHYDGSAGALELTAAEAARLTIERLTQWGYLEPDRAQ
jgi:electron transfer flavoprotein beta subunit